MKVKLPLVYYYFLKCRFLTISYAKHYPGADWKIVIHVFKNVLIFTWGVNAEVNELAHVNPAEYHFMYSRNTSTYFSRNIRRLPAKHIMALKKFSSSSNINHYIPKTLLFNCNVKIHTCKCYTRSNVCKTASLSFGL